MTALWRCRIPLFWLLALRDWANRAAHSCQLKACLYSYERRHVTRTSMYSL